MSAFLCRVGLHVWRNRRCIDWLIDGGLYEETCERCGKQHTVSGSY